MTYTGDMQQGRISKQHKVTVSNEVLELFEGLPLSRSAAIGMSILAVSRKPDLLHVALRHRMTQERTGNNVRVSYTREPRLEAMIDRLAEMTDLSGEQVIRLCMEAYIYRL